MRAVATITRSAGSRSEPPQRHHFQGDVRREGNDSEGGTSLQLIEQVIQTSGNGLASVAGQCDFERGDGADFDALSALDVARRTFDL